MSTPTPQIPTRRGSEEAGRYFRYMAEFVGFTDEDAQAIRQSSLVIEKHLPKIIADFYTNLLQYPPTRKIFLKKDGSVDNEYLELRMLHQANFWRRTAGGVYDDDYARFVDYVGRAHTSRGADPNIYIAERYVIGMVGFVQHAIIDALMKELEGYDDELEMRAIKGWNKLCMVILEMLARAYGDEREGEVLGELMTVDARLIQAMSVESYEKGLGLLRPMQSKKVRVALAAEIPEGERKIIQVDGASIGVFHHRGGWYALRNSCLHRGGPVATGRLVDNNLICPWHGYTYNVTDGSLLMDPSARLQMYPVTLQGDAVCISVPEAAQAGAGDDGVPAQAAAEREAPGLKANEFKVADVLPGKTALVQCDGCKVAVYNVDGTFYATQNECTHAEGPLNEGDLEGCIIECPWHYSRFDVTNGAVVARPAKLPLKTYRVIVEGEIGRVEA